MFLNSEHLNFHAILLPYKFTEQTFYLLRFGFKKDILRDRAELKIKINDDWALLHGYKNI